MSEEKIGFRFELKDGVKTMDIPEYSRWLCLIEAVQVIDNYSSEFNLNADEYEMKPSAIQKYMDERYHAMLKDVQIEIALGNIPAEVL